ncbi:MAG: NAD(P)-dependent oxidoreductase, partial [bacterium]
MRNNLLIIGASSCLANAISGSLKDFGYSICGTYNNNYPKDPENYKSLLKIDFLNKKQIKDIDDVLVSVDNIIFTIGDSNYLDENESKKNIDTLNNLIDHLRNSYKKCTKRIIFCSSSSVYGDSDSAIISEDSNKSPVSIYAKNKLQAENILSESGIPYVILRFPIIFGNSFQTKFVRLKEAVSKSKATIFGNGNNKFSFIHEKDLISAFSTILERNNIINTDINLSSKPVKQTEFINQLYKIINKEVVPRKTKIEDALKHAEREMNNFRKNGIKPTLFKEDIIGFSRDRTFDCSKAKKILNWTPKYKLEEAIKDTFQSLSFIERSEGIRILSFLFPQKTLPIIVYNKADQFKVTDFATYTNEPFVWNVIVKKSDKEGRVLTKHIFTKDINKAKTFMNVNKNWAEKVFVRVSPPRERVEYYGSILIDSKNFGNKMFISFSKINSADFVKEENGESFKILPRDLSSDIILE